MSVEKEAYKLDFKRTINVCYESNKIIYLDQDSVFYCIISEIIYRYALYENEKYASI